MTRSKVVRLLYIEDNLDDQLILKRVLKKKLNKEVKIDVADTASQGYDKIKNNEYDVIFLDYRLPDKTGLDLLSEIRDEGVTTPVFFLTGMGNEKIAVEAMKRGVDEYIIKNEVQSDDFISSLEKVLLKNGGLSESDADLSGLEKQLLNEFNQSGSEYIEPMMHNGVFSYSGIHDFVKRNGAEETGYILSQLEAKGKLVIESESGMILCPSCGGPVVGVDASSYVCNNCMSKDIYRIHIMSHPFCGYTGGKNQFVTERGLVCPNCHVVLNKRLSSGGDRDKNGYLVIGSAFECGSCSQRFNRPLMMHFCGSCGEKFTYQTMNYIKATKYQVI